MQNRSFSAHPQEPNRTGHVSALSDPIGLDALFKRSSSDIWAGKMPDVSKNGTLAAGDAYDAQPGWGNMTRKVAFVAISLGIIVAAIVGYVANVASPPSASAKVASAQELSFNPIQAPKEESYGLLGVQGIQSATGVMGLDAVSETRSVEMANNGNDPFEPIFGSDGSAATKEEELPPEIYFTGVVDDPVQKKRVAILKIRNISLDPNSTGPEFVTVVKKASQKFTVGDKTVVIQAISNSSVKLSVNGEPMSVPLDSFNTGDPNDPAMQSAIMGTAGAAPPSSASIKPVANTGKVNSITPASDNSAEAAAQAKSILNKLSE